METISLVSDEEVVSLSHAQVYVFFFFQILCYVFGKVNLKPTSNTVWEQQLGWFKDSSQYRTLDTIDGEPMEFEWNIFPGITTLQLCNKVQEFMSKMSVPSEFKGRIIFMSMFNDIMWGSEDNEQECDANATLVTLFARRFLPGTWSFLGPDQKRSGILLTLTDHKENGTESLNRWWSDSEKADTQFSEPRVHCPEERWKAKEVENYQYTSALMGIRLKLFFAQLFLLISSVSMEQSQICVMNTESAKQERTGRPVLAEQSDSVWASKIIDDNTYTFDRRSCKRRFIAKVPRTSGKALTTKSCD